MSPLPISPFPGNPFPGNLLEQILDRADAEQLTELLVAPGLTIERIVSIGHVTPPGEWLARDRAEWVLLLQGTATLRLGDLPDLRPMRRGDHVTIPAGLRHRVEATSTEPPCIWLAVHYREAAA